MSETDKALMTQLKNIESKTGKTFDELKKLVNESALTRHAELRDMLRERFDLGYGDANTVVHLSRNPEMVKSAGLSASEIEAAVSGYYAGKNEPLRPIHDAVMKRIKTLGEFEIAPKKKYLSLRRKKQFAMVGPASKGRVEVGLNMKDVQGTDRLESLPAGGMCQFRVFLHEPADVDDELMAWVQTAFESAG
jgi:hypothetical protein